MREHKCACRKTHDFARFSARWSQVPSLGRRLRWAPIFTYYADRVTFVAEYRDGSVARFDIDPWTLRNGHWVARIIARERQEEGSLKPGEIVRVYPDRRG